MEKIILWTVAGLFIPLFMLISVMALSSLSYDKNNPRDRSNSYYIQTNVEIDRPVEHVFKYIQFKIPDIYTDLTDMHTEFTRMNVYVYFDLFMVDDNKTNLQQTIDMINPFMKSFLDILGFLSGNRGEWEKQFHDELVNFKPIIEREWLHRLFYLHGTIC